MLSRSLINWRWTPASAGRTRYRPIASSTMSVDPRICGADPSPGIVPHNGKGGPPHLRGGPVTRDSTPQRQRWTPASAGRTASSIRTSRVTAVDPRICGADMIQAIILLAAVGGPPHLRGGPQRSDILYCRSGRAGGGFRTESLPGGRRPLPWGRRLPFRRWSRGGLALACVTGSALYWVLMDFPPRRWGGMSFWGEFGF